MQEVIARLSDMPSPHVLLVGDFILDRYVYGDVDRINPEAPVPVLRQVRCESRAGGAGNVAAAVPALEARVACVGVVGADAAGEELSRLLRAAGADTAGIVSLADRRRVKVFSRAANGCKGMPCPGRPATPSETLDWWLTIPDAADPNQAPGGT